MTIITRAMLMGAEEYIASEKSDPFVRDRVMSHMRNGIATRARGTPAEKDEYNYIPRADNQMRVRYYTPDHAGDNGYYTAIRTEERRAYTKADGELIEYYVPVWHSLERP